MATVQSSPQKYVGTARSHSIIIKADVSLYHHSVASKFRRGSRNSMFRSAVAATTSASCQSTYDVIFSRTAARSRTSFSFISPLVRSECPLYPSDCSSPPSPTPLFVFTPMIFTPTILGFVIPSSDSRSAVRSSSSSSPWQWL